MSQQDWNEYYEALSKGELDDIPSADFGKQPEQEPQESDDDWRTILFC